MRILITFSLLFGFSSAYAQAGAIYVFGAATTLGREIKQVSDQKKAKAAQEELDNDYLSMVIIADTLFAHKEYTKSLEWYNQALTIKQEQYVQDQIAKANAELNRQNLIEYEALLDKADTLYTQMKYPEAIDGYNTALKKRDEQYPKDRIAQIKYYQELWKTVHFSGLLISDSRIDSLSSKAYSNDPFTDFVGIGKFQALDKVLIYSDLQGLDGIAVPANTRLVIYSEPDFKGKVMLDVTGPVIINNVRQKTNKASQQIQSKTFVTPIQNTFPQSVRSWSVSDMKSWTKGSMEISRVE